MSPALRAGDQVFVARRRAPRRGDGVVARHPYRSDVHVVKRLVELDGTGGCELRGDNPAESSDSRVFGKVRSELIVGPVTSRV